MGKSVAVVLSGCGHRDGSEIREAVITLLELDRHDAKVQCFAPDRNQADVINHLTGEATDETRNVLVEAARIARGDIKPLQALDVTQFDALIFPGGFGAAKNLSDIAFKGKAGTATAEAVKIINDFHAAGKPIGAICIAPAMLTAALPEEAQPVVTIGDDNDMLIDALGGIHQPCETSACVVDSDNKLASCSAYMREAPLKEVAEGIAKVVDYVLQMAS